VLRFNGTLQFTNTELFRKRVFALADVSALVPDVNAVAVATSKKV
jgi:hypothetical protein